MAIDTYFILIVIAPVSTDQGHKELGAVDQVHINSKKTRNWSIISSILV